MYFKHLTNDANADEYGCLSKNTDSFAACSHSIKRVQQKYAAQKRKKKKNKKKKKKKKMKRRKR